MKKIISRIAKYSFLIITLLFFSENTYSQNQNTGVYLSWNNNNSCQIWDDSEREGEFIEGFEESPCLLVCQSSVSNFQLVNIPSGVNVIWDIVGGIVLSQNNNEIEIFWDDNLNGSITVEYSVNNNFTSKTLCVEKSFKPEANFTINNDATVDILGLTSCLSQSINFSNLSSVNGGSDIISYLWDFGDGNISYQENPQHIYSESGQYDVILWVSNACGCTDSIAGKIRVNEARTLEIDCPTVVCEGSLETYNLSIEAMENCTDFNWQISGGTIVNQAGGNVLVEWNNIDDTGFGYVTFYPDNCSLECNQPVTVKVPVIQNNASIVGNNVMCVGEQNKFTLPQWPTTDIQWSVVNPNGIDFQLILTDQRNEVVLWPINGNGTILLRAIYNNTLLNCGGVAELLIDVRDQLIIQASADKICQNEEIDFTNLSNEIIQWEIINNNNIVYTQNSQTLQYIFNDSGIYIVQGSSPNLCESNKLIIKVNEIPNEPSSIIGANEACTQVSERYEVLNPNPEYFYEWTISNGIILGNNLNSYINVEFFSFPSIINVRSYNPNTGCYSNFNSINVEADIPLADILSINSVTCSSSVGTFQAVIPSTTTPFNDADSYSWSLSDTSLGSISTGQGTNTVQITWNNVVVDTTVDVILTITKCSLPPTQIILPVIIKSIPQIQFHPQQQSSFCSNDTFQVNIQAIDPNINLANHNVIVRWIVDGQIIIGGISEFFNLVNNTDEEVLRGISAQIISYDGCNGVSNTIQFSVSISPSPPVFISATGSTRFCDLSDINTVLIASTNLIQVTYQWGVLVSNVFTPIVGATNSSFNPIDFGSYACLITATNDLSGCSRLSNLITISQQICSSNGGSNCYYPDLVVSNDSYYSDCGTITLSGSTSLSGLENWIVYGPGNEVVDLVNNTVVGPPGIYTIVYIVSVYCPEVNAYQTVERKIDVLIPFEPAIAYDFICNGTDVTLYFILNNSIFYPFLQNPQETVQLLVNGVWQTLNTSGSVDITGNPSNIIQLRVINTGSFNSQNYECIKNYDIATYGVPDNEIFIQNNDFICHDTPFSFGFLDLIQNPENYSYSWSFEPGVTNSLFNPSRVFNSPGTYPIQVEIINALGCSRVLTTEVIVPEPCFEGTLQVAPTDANVCQGESITISYISTVENCTPIYLWRRGNTLLSEFMNQSSINVTEPGYYWLEIVSSDGCIYEVPNRIYPKFNTPPALRVYHENQYCVNDNIEIKAISSGTIEWFLEGISVNVGEIWNPVLSEGTHNITVIAQDAMGCSTVENFILSISPSPTNVYITGEVLECDPFSIKLSAFCDQPAEFLWSNGQVGEFIMVNHGGAYQVTAKIGSCTVHASLNVPKHPEVYAWAYPQGCYNYCLDFNPYILGPLATLTNNIWMVSGDVLDSSIEPSPIFQLPIDGAYNGILLNSNCTYKAPPLHYQIDRCEDCKLTIRESRIDYNHTNYCSFSAQFFIINETTQIMEIQLIDPDNLVTFTPSTFILQPGVNTITTTILPVNGFTGNASINIFINGTSYDRDFNPIPCLYQLRVYIPRCSVSPSPLLKQFEKKTTDTGINIHFSPNPVTNEATLSWDVDFSIDQYQLFDIRGQLLTQQMLTSNITSTKISMEHLPKGVYIITLWSKMAFVKYLKVIKN